MGTLRRSLPAGVADAGFASLATFAVGLYGVRAFSAEELGVYAVFFSAFVLAAKVANELIGYPAIVATIRSNTSHRLDWLIPTLKYALGPAVAASAVIGVAAFAMASRADGDFLAALLVTAVPATILSPLQDIVRRFFHTAGESWQAAAISTTQFVVVAGFIALAIGVDLTPALVPFGALTAANTCSIALGLILALRERVLEPVTMTFRGLVRGGRWLLLRALLPTSATFISLIIIDRLAGTAAVGYAEAARIAAHPILVLAFGLSAVLQPRSVEAAATRSRALADQVQRILGVTLLTGTVAYGLIAGPAGWWNPMEVLVPNAYEIPGLVAVSLLANLVIGWFYTREAEFMGAKRERDLLRIESVASPVALAVALTAGWTGAFARPLGQLGMALTRIAVSVPYRRPIYSDEEAEPRTPHGDLDRAHGT